VAPLKGALVTFLPGSSLPSVITFQLNPETITHGLIAAPGTPVETFVFTLMLDASQAASPGSDFVQSQLNALRALLFPADPQSAPPAVLFSWGSRQVPARVTGLTITEKLFDSLLNPTQAEAAISLAALTPAELAALPAPMNRIANAAYDALAQARAQALRDAQNGTGAERQSRMTLMESLRDAIKCLNPPLD
jgi:hypothetical protein